MHDPGSIVPYIWRKVFTNYQKSRIKCSYYINKVSKDYDDPRAEWNNGRLYNTTRMATGAIGSLELLVEEF
jgi:hypothetical protein